MQIGDKVIIAGTVVDRQPGNGDGFVLSVEVGEGHHPLVVHESAAAPAKSPKPAKSMTAKTEAE